MGIEQIGIIKKIVKKKRKMDKIRLHIFLFNMSQKIVSKKISGCLTYDSCTLKITSYIQKKKKKTVIVE